MAAICHAIQLRNLGTLRGGHEVTAIWKDADPFVPASKQAKAEYAGFL